MPLTDHVRVPPCAPEDLLDLTVLGRDRAVRVRKPARRLSDIALGGYSTLQQVGLILAFNAIMFVLLEIPLIGYLVRPEATAKRVATTSRWRDANGLRITGWLIGLFGAGLLAEGVAALAS